MKNKLNLTQRIRALKAGQHFIVTNKADREQATRDGNTLYRAGVIEFQIVTRAVEENGVTKWKVAAI